MPGAFGAGRKILHHREIIGIPDDHAAIDFLRPIERRRRDQRALGVGDIGRRRGGVRRAGSIDQQCQGEIGGNHRFGGFARRGAAPRDA